MDNYIMRKVVEEISVEKFVDDFNRKNKLGGSGKIEPLTTEMFLAKNKGIIEKNYTPQDVENGFKGIKPNTDVWVPISKIEIEEQMLFGANQLWAYESYGLYLSVNQSELLSDPLYVQSSVITLKDSNHKVNIQNLNVRVWIYSKVLNKVIDVSPFVNRLNTNKSFNMGQFSISLDPFKSTEDITSYTLSQNIEGVVNIFNFVDFKGGYVEDFFEKYIQFNDLVFIRFERLQMEEDGGSTEGLQVPLSRLGNNTGEIASVWDMIGLVDSSVISTDQIYTNRSIDIMGRDFSKLFTDDGAYFFPLKYISNDENPSMFAAGDRGSSWFKRNVATGEFDQYFFNYDFKSIKDYAFFIMNHLSNLGIIDDEVFGSWGDRKSKFDVVDGIENGHKVKGVWNIVKLFVDTACNNRRVTGMLGNPEGTLSEMFDRICKYPLVEMFGDTWIDTYDIVIRQPPHNKKAIQEVASNENLYINIEKCDTFSTRLSYDDRYYSWYKVEPLDGVVGNLKGMVDTFVPVVYFNKMAEKFGNKRFIFEDIYVRLGATNGKNGVNDMENMIFNLIDDLCYVIESTAYLPFTRRGVIVINGDRRIKVGTFIRLELTDELFYVINVTNNLTMMNGVLERTTTLQVERGMRMDLIKGKEVIFYEDSESKIPKGYLTMDGVKFINYCYFDIVNTEEIRSRMKERFDKNLVGKFETNSPTDFGLNDDVFDFFMKRKYLQ